MTDAHNPVGGARTLEAIRLSFAGSLAIERLGVPPGRAVGIVEQLVSESTRIAKDIDEELSLTTKVPVHVSIDIRQGSIDWSGMVELFPTVWQAAEAMATIGGAAALVQMVGEGITLVLRRRIKMALPAQAYQLDEHLYTRVRVVSMPLHALEQTRQSQVAEPRTQ